MVEMNGKVGLKSGRGLSRCSSALRGVGKTGYLCCGRQQRKQHVLMQHLQMRQRGRQKGHGVFRLKVSGVVLKYLVACQATPAQAAVNGVARAPEGPLLGSSSISEATNRWKCLVYVRDQAASRFNVPHGGVNRAGHGQYIEGHVPRQHLQHVQPSPVAHIRLPFPSTSNSIPPPLVLTHLQPNCSSTNYPINHQRPPRPSRHERRPSPPAPQDPRDQPLHQPRKPAARNQTRHSILV